MARFFGKVGFGHTVETSPGVHEMVITERDYYGNVLSNSVKSDDGSSILPNLTIGNSFSIVADAYANENFWAIQYITWSGVRWSVVDVKVLPPRLIIRPGEVYNGPTP